MIVTEALSLVGGDGAAVLKAREAVWRVVVHDQRDAPAADRLGTALLDACEQGLFDDLGGVADSEAAGPAGTGCWRTSLVCKLAGPLHRERLRLVWFSAEPTAFSGDLGLAELFAQHVGTALVAVTERVTLEQAIAARHRIGQAQGILMARLEPDRRGVVRVPATHLATTECQAPRPGRPDNRQPITYRPGQRGSWSPQR